MKKIWVSVIIISLMSGCGSINYKESKLANTKNQTAVGALIGSGGVETIYAGDSAKTILSQTSSSKAEKALLEFKNACESQQKALVAPALVPILSAIPKIIYDISSDRKNKKLEALKKSSSASYSVDFVLPKGSLNNYQCLVIIRHDLKNVVNAAVAYKIEINGALVSLRPIFAWAKNTVANTREVEKGKKEEITFMSGFSLQGIGKQENGLPILASSGQDAKKISKFSLRNEDVKHINNNLTIGPVPIIESSDISILRLSLTEVGDLGFDVDDRIAANKTIKEAIGPALAEGVKTYLTEE